MQIARLKSRAFFLLQLLAMTSKQTLVPDKYIVVPRVLIFAFDRIGKVLLLKGAPTKKIWPNVWNGLGGHIEAGESPIEAAQREFKEESGLTAGDWKLCGEIAIDTGQRQGIAVWVFKAQMLSGELSDSVEGEPAWLTLEEALKLDLVEDLYTLLPIVAGMTEGEKPYWVKYSYDSSDQLLMRIWR